MYHAKVLDNLTRFVMRPGLPLILLPLLASCSSLPTWHQIMPLPSRLSFAPHKMDISQGNVVTTDMREKVRVGMTRAQVKSILGTPLLVDPFHADRWDYLYRFEREGKLYDNQRYTLFFQGDQLARIDDSQMPDPATATPGKVEMTPVDPDAPRPRFDPTPSKGGDDE